MFLLLLDLSGSDKVTVHYAGSLIDGTEFDSSYKRGKTTTFGLNQVIAGANLISFSKIFVLTSA